MKKILKTFRHILFSVICVIIIIVCGACSGNNTISTSASSTMEGTIENFHAAIVNCDEVAYIEAMMPKSGIKEWQEASCASEEEFWLSQREVMESNYSIVCTDIVITDKDEVYEDRIYDKELDLYDYLSADVDITEAYENIEFEYLDENGEEGWSYVDCMYKSGGKWYIFPDIY